ncbi:hypothetical protein GF373_03080 [bacterium]|nr:hypothetical protein [bacterium]
MSLHHFLSQMPHEQLQGLAEEFGVSFLSPSKTTLINSVMAKYRDEKFMVLLLDELSYEATGLLASLAFLTESRDGRIEVPRQIAGCWSQNGSLVEHLNEIVNRGFLFQGGNRLEPDNLYLPEEVRNIVIRLFSSQLENLPVEREIPLKDLSFNVTGLEAIFHLLCVLRHHPAKQTLKGDIHRKTFERWKERFGPFEPTESQFQFCIEFCHRHGLLDLKNERFRPTQKADIFFKQGNEGMRISLLHFFFEHVIYPSQHFQKLLFLLYGLYHRFPSTYAVPAYAITDLERQFTQLRNLHHSADEIDLRQFRSHLRQLAFIGLIWTDKPEEPSAFSFTKEGLEFLFGFQLETQTAGEQTEPCMLQPTFQLLVPPQYGFATLWKLDEICEFQKHDIMTEFVLSRQSILFALRGGWTAEEIKTFLEELTQGRIPDIVRYSVDDWCEKYGQITFRKVMLLECKTPQLAEEIAHVPGVKDHLLEQIADKLYVIDEYHARQLYQLLLNAGYEPAVLKKTDEDK